MAERERQLIDQDAHTGEWALLHPGEESPINLSARGYIPETKATRQKRIEDELVRFLLANGWDRQVVADAMDIQYRTTWHKERRAQAYEIPLAAITGKGQGSQVGPAELRREVAATDCEHSGPAGPGDPRCGDD